MVLGLLIFLGSGGYKISKNEALGGPFATTTGEAYNVVGTRVGTTTTAVSFGISNGKVSATTTYPVGIGNGVDTASFFFDITQASTTGSFVLASFLTSNNASCHTAITTTNDNVPTVNQIKWFDAGDKIQNVTTSSLLRPSGTTTLQFAVYPGTNKEITLKNMNSRCIALEVAASATAMQVQMVGKSLQGY